MSKFELPIGTKMQVDNGVVIDRGKDGLYGVRDKRKNSTIYFVAKSIECDITELYTLYKFYVKFGGINCQIAHLMVFKNKYTE